jgi:hypothetical protein
MQPPKPTSLKTKRACENIFPYVMIIYRRILLELKSKDHASSLPTVGLKFLTN